MPAKAEIREFATNPFHLEHPLPDVFDSEGREIDRPRELLQQLGAGNLGGLVGVLPPDPGAVQNAPTGVIRTLPDPRSANQRLAAEGRAA
jgi:hypothetical protein